MDYQEKEVIAGKKFITKILNATNFIFQNLKYQKKIPNLCETDKLFLTKLNKVIKNATEAFEDFNYSKAKSEADNFFWKDFCDNYLEIVKKRVYSGNEKEKASAYYVLYQSLLNTLKLMAPFTPYITEEIYQKYFRKFEGKKSIHLEDWPVAEGKENKEEIFWDKLIEIISKVRQLKSEAKKPMNSEIILTIEKKDYELLVDFILDLKNVTNSKEINQGKFEVEFV